MKLLFISSGNNKHILSSKIQSQGESLIEIGIKVDYHQIRGKGLFGYLKNIPSVRKRLRIEQYDIIHAHYSLVGIIASLAGAKPLVVSLMGSDVFENKFLRLLAGIFSRFFWEITIVKSNRMSAHLPFSKPIVIPNGVNLNRFKPIPEIEINKYFPDKKLPWVIFIGDPSLKEKNYDLAFEAMKLIKDIKHEFILVNNVESESIPYYMNAASALVMTSLWEGSPNIIKEAMACNLPIVSVDVGDIVEVLSDTKGCIIASYEKTDIAEKLRGILMNETRTNGREKIHHLSSKVIADKLNDLYLSII